MQTESGLSYLVVVAYVVDGDIVVGEFEFQSGYYDHFGLMSLVNV